MNITNFYGDPLFGITTLTVLAQQAERRFNALPQEEQDRIIAEREAEKEVEKTEKNSVLYSTRGMS